MKNLIVILLTLFFASDLYSNPLLPSIRINEFGFNDKGWIIELVSDYSWFPSTKLRFISNTDTSTYFTIPELYEENIFYVLTNDSLNSSFYINPDGDLIALWDSLGICYDFLGFGKTPYGSIVDTLKNGQSICFWRKPLGKVFYYLDNSPTFGLANDSIDATGIIKGTLKDTLGNPIPDAKVFYDYETFYGAGDIYVFTDDLGYFFINHFAERVLLKFKKNIFYDEKISIQIYPDSTIELNIILKTNVLSDVEEEIKPYNFILEQNYPNPFNPVTRIKYSIPQYTSTPAFFGRGDRGRLVTLEVYDILGNEIIKLVNSEHLPGNYEVEFSVGSSGNASTYNLSSGIYFYVLKANGKILTRKMCLIK